MFWPAVKRNRNPPRRRGGQVEEAVSAAVVQTTCPIMDQPINKSLFTEYKGKKVYFCCLGCKEKFEQEPEKYLAKLPQFKD